MSNYKGVGKYRLILNQGIEFESFHDIKDALDTWFNPIFANIHQGGEYTIKLKDNSEKEEYPYILEFTPLTERPLMVMGGGDIVNNFEFIYDREPNIQEFILMKKEMIGVYGNMDYSELNEDISREIYDMIDRGVLPAPPEEVDE